MRWLGPSLIAVAFLAAAALSWRKWPDVIVDFGMQLYIPWKISTGSVLYRDLKYLTGGPFSQYFNASLFRIFGVSLMTLATANLLIAAGLVALIYRKFLAASDALTATLIGVAVVLVFAFGQYSDIANYNYVTPYSHEVWHGLALSIVTIALLSHWIKIEKFWLMAPTGFCTALVFMTKPDIFIALFVGVAVAFVLFTAKHKQLQPVLKPTGLFLGAALLPLLVFFFYFLRNCGLRESLRSVCFAWVPLFNSSVSETPFYKWCTGMDAPWLNFRYTCIHFAIIVIALAASAMIFRRSLEKPSNRLLAIGWIALLVGLASSLDWVDCGRALPLLDVGLIVMLISKLRRDSEQSPIFPLLWSVFALVLLSKLGFFPRIWHYGFALAMPAFVAAIYLLLWELPGWLQQRGVNRFLFRLAAALVLLTGIARLFTQSQFVLDGKSFAVGTGADKLVTWSDKSSRVGPDIQSALDWMEKNAPKDATLAVLPEGVMINYLSRRANPGHYLLWNGNDVAAFGQAEMTADFEKFPSDYILFVHRDESEYGLKPFGQDQRFGLDLMRWIEKNYEPIFRIGDEPFSNTGFGVKILRRLGAGNQIEHAPTSVK